MSSFFDDLQAKAKSVISGQMSNVGPYLLEQVLGSPQLVKVGSNPGGNLTAAQIKAGAKPAQQTISKNSNAGNDPLYSQNGNFLQNYGLYIAAGFGALVIIALIVKR